MRRNGVTVDGTAPVDEHAPIGELGKQRVDGILQTQRALLDEEQRPDRDDRFRHRRDAEDAVSANRIGFTPGEVAGDADLDVIAAGGEPRHAADPVLFHVAGHHVMKAPEPAGIESAHTLSDVTTVANSSVAPLAPACGECRGREGRRPCHNPG